MAYYTKKEVWETIQRESEKTQSKNLKPLTPIEHSKMQLENEEDIVGYFWINITEGEKLEMESLVFVRVDSGLYTDDRFAIDMYQAQRESKTVSEVVFDRLKGEGEKVPENIETEVKDKIKNIIKKG